MVHADSTHATLRVVKFIFVRPCDAGVACRQRVAGRAIVPDANASLTASPTNSAAVLDNGAVNSFVHDTGASGTYRCLLITMQAAKCKPGRSVAIDPYPACLKGRVMGV